MKFKKRKLIFFAVLLMVLITMFCSTFTVNAAKKDKIPIPNVQKDVYIYDVDNIIDDNIEKKMNALLVQLEEKTEAEVAVITVESLLDMEIEDYSLDLANTLGIGKKDQDNGVLLLISKSDKKVRLEIGKGLEGCLNDSKCGRILDDYFVPYREEDKYTEGTYKTIQAVVSVIAKEYDTSIGEIDDKIANHLEEEEKEANKKLIIIIIIVIVIVVILIVLDLIFFDGELLIPIFLGGAGGSSSGGFGGGSFGGGGASR